MNILMVLYLKYPDIRVVKEVSTLISHGYKVVVLASNDGNEVEYEEKFEGKLVILRPKEFTNHYCWKVLRYFLFSVNFYDSWLNKQINKLIDEYNIKIIHVHDLRLVKTAKVSAKKFKLPIVVDLHENYPAAIKAYTEDNSLKSIIRRNYIDSYNRWKQYEKNILKNVDFIITVVEESQKRIIDLNVIPKENVKVVSNTESVEKINLYSNDEMLLNEYKDDFVISYIGGVDKHRGIETVLNALPLILNRISNLKFIIVGGINDTYLKTLRDVIEKLKIEKSVEFIGRVPLEDVPKYINISKFGIIPQYANEHCNYTVPHKLFQYLSMGKPVIVSDAVPLKRIVKEGQCGLVFKSGSSYDLADVFCKYFDGNDKKYFDLCENAKNITIHKYNWNNDGNSLLEIYSKLTVG